MKLSDYLDAEKGRAAELASSINAQPPLISQWKSGDRPVPAERCIEIERATRGAVRCEDMRPDIDWAVLRRTSRKTVQ